MKVRLTVTVTFDDVPDDVDPESLYLAMSYDDFRLGGGDENDTQDEAECVDFGTVSVEEITGNDCPECARSNGPNYRGPCEH